jgi:integrase
MDTGAWRARARFRDVDGRTREMARYAPTRVKATNALTAAMRDRLKPVTEGIDRDTALDSLATLWWEEYTSRSRPTGTLQRYENALRLHIRAKAGGWRVAECSVSRLDRFIKQVTKDAGYSTAGICVVLLSGMLDMAARHDALESNPMRSIAPVHKPDHEITAFTLDDITALRQILAAWDAGKDAAGRARVSDLADPVDMFLATGCRPGEIFALEWKDIQFATAPPEVEIRGTVVRGEDGKRVVQPRLKGGRGRRLKLPPFAVEMLLRRRVHSLSDRVFPSSTGTLRIPDNFREQWHLALKDTRFRGAVPKDFRSTVATLIRDESTLDNAQGQLGHKSRSITEKHYAKNSMEGPDVTAVLQQFAGKAGSKR